MANVNVNTTPRRSINGGQFKLTGATDTYIVQNYIDEGWLEWSPVMRERIPLKDRGQYSATAILEGDDIIGQVTLKVKGANLQGSSSLYALLTAAGATGNAKVYASAIVDIPDYRGAATGGRLTFTSIWLAEPPRTSAGREHDEITYVLNYLSGPAPASH